MFTETLLLDRVSDENERRECLQIIGTESERLSRLVERILDFSRMEAGRRAYRLVPTRVDDVVDAAVTACRPLAEEKGFEIERIIPDDLPQVPLDRDAMVEVLINLLSNAIKYSPEHKQVTVSAQVDEQRLRLSVADKGMGIPRAEQKRIFDRFYRVAAPLASEVSGSGLGLSLVRYIVKGHGGEVHVDSTPGKGSTFTVVIPRQPGKEAS
jgi:two-component system phosphate regulon sensor histidine kinase PhoR